MKFDLIRFDFDFTLPVNIDFFDFFFRDKADLPLSVLNFNSTRAIEFGSAQPT